METADLSAGGLSFRFRGMMHQGAMGVVLLKKSDGQHLLRCVEVVYCRYAGKSQHIIGARWVDMPPNLPVAVRSTESGPRLSVNL